MKTKEYLILAFCVILATHKCKAVRGFGQSPPPGDLQRPGTRKHTIGALTHNFLYPTTKTRIQRKSHKYVKAQTQKVF